MTYGETVEDCLLLTRVVTVKMIGPGPYFKVRSQTYMKDGIRLVKEVISWAWNPPYGANTDCDSDNEYLGCGINWTKITPSKIDKHPTNL